MVQYCLDFMIFIYSKRGNYMNTFENDKYISLEDAANYLGIRPVTLRSWIRNPKNEVPAHKIGRFWKFKRSEIDEWVNSGKSAIDE